MIGTTALDVSVIDFSFTVSEDVGPIFVDATTCAEMSAPAVHAAAVEGSVSPATHAYFVAARSTILGTIQSSFSPAAGFGLAATGAATGPTSMGRNVSSGVNVTSIGRKPCGSGACGVAMSDLRACERTPYRAAGVECGGRSAVA